MDSELCPGKRSTLPSRSSGNSLPEGPDILGELSLTSGEGNEDDILSLKPSSWRCPTDRREGEQYFGGRGFVLGNEWGIRDRWGFF